jgi:F-type H+-transporting ATPase subunit delta
LSSQTVARRYASALADVVVAQNEALAVRQELAVWEQMIVTNPLLQEVFKNPTIPYEQKRNVLSELIARTKVRPTTANFLQVLLRNQRLAELHEVNKRFVQVLDDRAGVVGAHVTSARPIAESQKRSLEEKLVTMTGKDVRLSFSTDESLIGGMVTRIGSTVYDGSVRNQLQQLGARLAGK